MVWRRGLPRGVVPASERVPEEGAPSLPRETTGGSPILRRNIPRLIERGEMQRLADAGLRILIHSIKRRGGGRRVFEPDFHPPPFASVTGRPRGWSPERYGLWNLFDKQAGGYRMAVPANITRVEVIDPNGEAGESGRVVKQYRRFVGQRVARPPQYAKDATSDTSGGQSVRPDRYYRRGLGPLDGPVRASLAAWMQARAVNFAETYPASSEHGNAKRGTFVVVPLPEHVAKGYPHKAADDSPPHLTVLYCGKQTRAVADKLATALAEAVKGKIEALHLAGEGRASFPAGPDGVPVYTPVRDPDGKLAGLHKLLADAAREAGVEWTPTHASYTPHVTICYAKDEDEAQRVNHPESWFMRADRLKVCHGDDTVAVLPLDGPRDAARLFSAQQYFARGDKLFPRVVRGKSDGRTVRSHVPNMASLGATFSPSDEVDRLRGIRNVPMWALGAAGKRPPPSELSRAIAASNEVNPLIVGMYPRDDRNGPFIVEGAHRLEALDSLGAKSFPASVTIPRRGHVGSGLVARLLRARLAEGGPPRGQEFAYAPPDRVPPGWPTMRPGAYAPPGFRSRAIRSLGGITVPAPLGNARRQSFTLGATSASPTEPNHFYGRKRARPQHEFASGDPTQQLAPPQPGNGLAALLQRMGLVSVPAVGVTPTGGLVQPYQPQRQLPQQEFGLLSSVGRAAGKAVSGIRSGLSSAGSFIKSRAGQMGTGGLLGGVAGGLIGGPAGYAVGAGIGAQLGSKRIIDAAKAVPGMVSGAVTAARQFPAGIKQAAQYGMGAAGSLIGAGARGVSNMVGNAARSAGSQIASGYRTGMAPTVNTPGSFLPGVGKARTAAGMGGAARAGAGSMDPIRGAASWSPSPAKAPAARPPSINSMPWGPQLKPDDEPQQEFGLLPRPSQLLRHVAGAPIRAAHAVYDTVGPPAVQRESQRAGLSPRAARIAGIAAGASEFINPASWVTHVPVTSALASGGLRLSNWLRGKPRLPQQEFSILSGGIERGSVFDVPFERDETGQRTQPVSISQPNRTVPMSDGMIDEYWRLSEAAREAGHTRPPEPYHNGPLVEVGGVAYHRQGRVRSPESIEELSDAGLRGDDIEHETHHTMRPNLSRAARQIGRGSDLNDALAKMEIRRPTSPGRLREAMRALGINADTVRTAWRADPLVRSGSRQIGGIPNLRQEAEPTRYVNNGVAMPRGWNGARRGQQQFSYDHQFAAKRRVPRDERVETDAYNAQAEQRDLNDALSHLLTPLDKRNAVGMLGPEDARKRDQLSRLRELLRAPMTHPYEVKRLLDRLGQGERGLPLVPPSVLAEVKAAIPAGKAAREAQDVAAREGALDADLARRQRRNAPRVAARTAAQEAERERSILASRTTPDPMARNTGYEPRARVDAPVGPLPPTQTRPPWMPLRGPANPVTRVGEGIPDTIRAALARLAAAPGQLARGAGDLIARGGSRLAGLLAPRATADAPATAQSQPRGNPWPSIPYTPGDAAGQPAPSSGAPARREADDPAYRARLRARLAMRPADPGRPLEVQPPRPSLASMGSFPLAAVANRPPVVNRGAAQQPLPATPGLRKALMLGAVRRPSPAALHTPVTSGGYEPEPADWLPDYMPRAGSGARAGNESDWRGLTLPPSMVPRIAPAPRGNTWRKFPLAPRGSTQLSRGPAVQELETYTAPGVDAANRHERMRRAGETVPLFVGDSLGVSRGSLSSADKRARLSNINELLSAERGGRSLRGIRRAFGDDRERAVAGDMAGNHGARFLDQRQQILVANDRGDAQGDSQRALGRVGAVNRIVFLAGAATIQDRSRLTQRHHRRLLSPSV